MKKVAVSIFIFLLLFTRLYNLPATTRFTRDESSNLVDMHRIFVEKKLTLIGPIDVNNVIIYPSLTFYMLMPFAVIWGFATYSPAYGTAFYGILTVLLTLLLVKRFNKKFLVLFSVLLLFSFPLIESARWAWNPHLVPLMTALALLSWTRKGKWSAFVSGIFFGLSFHLHYFSVVSFSVFLFLVAVLSLRRKSFKRPLFMALGFSFMIIPFVIFDLRNPPGLFFGRFLGNNLVTQNFSHEIGDIPLSLTKDITGSLTYLAQFPALSLALSLVLLALLLHDIRKRSEALIYFFPVFSQVSAISFLPGFAGRYFLLCIVFFFVYLMHKRDKFGEALSKTAILIMIAAGMLSVGKLLDHSQMPPGGYVVEAASQKMSNLISELDLKNVNLAVLASADNDPQGIIYRHTLLVKEKRILSGGEYGITDNLFVISTSDIDQVRHDPANLINGFRNGKLVLSESVENTPWKVYLLNRD